MNTTIPNKRTVLLAAMLAVSVFLGGCVAVDDDGYDYRTQQQKDDDMAKEALHDSMEGLSKEDKEALSNLGK